MANCGNCKNCGDSSKGASQRSYVAYIQPCGAGPSKDSLNAMVDGGYGSAIKVTGGTRQIRGSRTAKRKRKSDGTTELCYYTESSPGENTVSLEFASCGCGGYSPEELAAEGTFDLYQMQACCGSADMSSGWSKMHVMRCISFNSLSFSDQTSYDPDDDNDIVHTFDANYVDDYYLYPLDMNEIANGIGVSTGARINSMVFVSQSSSCKTECKDDCGGYWYAVTNTGTILYRCGSDKPIQSVAIPGFTATNNAQIGLAGSQLVVAGRDNYYTAPFSSSTCAPGVFTQHAVPTGFVVDSIFSGDSTVTLAGNNGTAYRMWTIDANGNLVQTYANNTAATAMTGYDECGGTSAAVGSYKVLIGSTCGSLSETATLPPTAASGLLSVAVRPGGDVWVGTNNGETWYTSDGGETWNKVSMPATVGRIESIQWVDAGTGYIATGNPAQIFSTADGGNTWTASGSDGRISSLGNAQLLTSINIPCCKSKTKTMNSIMATGITNSNTGGLWQSSISSCS